jgi:2-beta-glucuronyltransferase
MAKSHGRPAQLTSKAPFLVVTGHDFRSRRKANIHFIAHELSRRGKTRVFSLGFSQLSRLKKDPRLPLWNKANKIETVAGVDCYLWRTILHPFNLRRSALDPLAAAWFRSYVKSAPKIFDEWASESATIVLESGMPPIMAERIRALNPGARLLYLASDDLRTLGCSNFIVEELARTANLYNSARLPSKQMRGILPANLPSFVIPHGLDRDIANHTEPSPYGPGVNAVSVGSMLFDAEFFAIAAAAFPQVTFHVIGAGAKGARLSAPNILVYDEMAFLQTVPYIKHAAFGIAPYCADGVAPYLADTSMKLMQYGFLGVPAVCPQVTVGDHAGRFGYEPGDPASIAGAIEGALNCRGFAGERVLSWSEVTDRIVGLAANSDAGLHAHQTTFVPEPGSSSGASIKVH